MKEVFISYPVDYIMGHLRYGHKEGTIQMTEEEFEEFQKDPAKWLKTNECGALELLVDDWEIDDYDDNIYDVEWSECNWAKIRNYIQKIV